MFLNVPPWAIGHRREHRDLRHQQALRRLSALDRVSLEVQSGQLLALLGPSGFGKTTLLRIMAGLERPDSGAVRLHGEDAVGQGPRERQVGFVFQHYVLFRHMSVFDNVAFGLSVRPRARGSKAEIAERVHRLLSLVQLDWVGDPLRIPALGRPASARGARRALAIEPEGAAARRALRRPRRQGAQGAAAMAAAVA